MRSQEKISPQALFDKDSTQLMSHIHSADKVGDFVRLAALYRDYTAGSIDEQDAQHLSAFIVAFCNSERHAKAAEVFAHLRSLGLRALPPAYLSLLRYGLDILEDDFEALMQAMVTDRVPFGELDASRMLTRMRQTRELRRASALAHAIMAVSPPATPRLANMLLAVLLDAENMEGTQRWTCLSLLISSCLSFPFPRSKGARAVVQHVRQRRLFDGPLISTICRFYAKERNLDVHSPIRLKLFNLSTNNLHYSPSYSLSPAATPGPSLTLSLPLSHSSPLRLFSPVTLPLSMCVAHRSSSLSSPMPTAARPSWTLGTRLRLIRSARSAGLTWRLS